jgi:general secretion pathway protein C
LLHRTLAGVFLAGVFVVTYLLTTHSESETEGTITPPQVNAIVSHRAPSPAPAVTATRAAARASRETFVLLATFAQANPRRGQAIIGTSPENARMSGVGDPVAPGAVLREIFSDHVIVEHDGTRELVLLTQPNRPAGAAAPSTLAAVASAPPPSAIADTVRLAPGSATDPVQGMRVFPGRNRGEFAKLGLHPGDLITAVDGVPVAGQPAENLLTLVKGGSAASVTVFRAGREQQIALHPTD